jgi:hypothetical protein
MCQCFGVGTSYGSWLGLTIPAYGWDVTGSLTIDGLHRLGFPILLWDVLQLFGYVKKPDYHGRLFHEFKIGRCEVRVDIPLNVKQPNLMAWSTSATGHHMSNTLEMVAHQALEMFCEQHLLDTADTPIALFPIRN